ncbi:Pre-mRNA-processing factor 39 [Spathaspora sp. JA1]|nr:Pre-mRNA-processing factor 39 [Spathaspora sp. JA1]
MTVSMESETNSEWSKISTQLVQDPANLKLWQQLIETAEFNNKQGITKSSTPHQLQLLRVSYQELLKNFPLCFNYWIRYAAWEFKLGDSLKSIEIYQSALQHLPFCIEVWISYLQFRIDTLKDMSDLQEILQLFEKARGLIGVHFHSFEFYKLYLTFLDSYQDDTNEFGKKYYVLLRVVLEIPLYHYEYFYKLWFDIVAKIGQDQEFADKVVPYIIPQLDHTNYKTISINLKKLFIDAYITTQFKVYELYQFEKKLSRQYYDDKFISRQQLDTWFQYLEFLDVKQYSFTLVELTYHRFIHSTARYPDSWIKFADFYIFHERYNSARSALTRGVVYNGDYRIVLKLVDLEIFLKQYFRARELIVNYIQYNVSVPIPIYEKLLNIERVFNTDDEYILQLFRQIITQTQNDYFFSVLLNYSIDTTKLIDFVKSFEITGKFYTDACIKLNINKPVVPSKDYDTILNTY